MGKQLTVEESFVDKNYERKVNIYNFRPNQELVR